MNRFALTLSLMIALLASTSAFAQDFNLNWHTVDSGGGASAGGDFALAGTVGQHDASALMIGNAYSLSGGFWYPADVVPSACPGDLFPPSEDCGLGDGTIGAGDLGALLSSWGPCPDCCADLLPLPSGDGVVGPSDLAALLASWGQCG
jgi:hypothetical protein